MSPARKRPASAGRAREEGAAGAVVSSGTDVSQPSVSSTALVPAEKSAIADSRTARLKALEQVIREELPGHIKSSVSVGLALREIKDRRLFHPYFEDWDSYITDQWGLSRSYTYQLMDAARVVVDIQKSLEAYGKSAIADSTVITIIGNEWRARQLKDRVALVVKRIQKGEDPQAVVDSEVAKAKRDRDQKAIQRQQHPEPDQDQEDDQLVRMENGSGDVITGTRFQSGRVAVGTAKLPESLVAGVNQKVADQAPTLTLDLKIMMAMLADMERDQARELLLPYQSVILSILGIDREEASA